MDKGDGGLTKLLAQGYNVLNDLNKAADVSLKQKILMRNGQLAQAKAKDLITNLHRMVDAFDGLLQTFITGVVKDRNDVLVSHSKEIIENVEYITDLCTMSERMLSEQSNLTTLVEIQAQFMQILQECEDLKYVDYETFTSVDLEVDLQDLFKAPLAKIISKNSKHLERHTLHSLGFGDLITHAGEDMPISSNVNIPESEADSGFEKGNSSIVDLTNSETDLPSHIDLTQSASEPSLNNVPVRNDQAEKTKPCGNKSVAKSKREVHVRPCYMDQEVPKSSVPTKIGDSTQQPATGADSLNWRDSSKVNEKVDDTATAPSRADCPNWRANRFSQEPKVMREPSETTLSILAEQKKVLQNYQNMQQKKAEKSSASSSKSIDSNRGELKEKGCKEDPKVRTATKLSAIEKITSLLPSNDSDLDEGWDLPPSLKPNPKNYTASQKTNTNTNNRDIQTEVSTSKDEGWDLPPSLKPTPKKEYSERTKSTGSIFQQKSSCDPDLPEFKFSLKSVMGTSSSGLKEIYGSLVKTITGRGSTQFSFPTGLTVRSDGLLVVADTGNNEIKFMQDNTMVMSIGPEQGVRFKRPSAIVCDAQDNIYVKDDFGVQIFDVNGKKIDSFGHFQRPYGLGLSKFGSKTHVVTIDEGRGDPKICTYCISESNMQKYQYSPLLEYGSQASSKVRFLATYGNTVLASDLGSSMMYLSTIDGRPIKSFGKLGYSIGEFREPSGVTVDADGNWLVGDSKNNRIQVFNNEGFFLAMLNLSVSVKRPSGIHLASDGHLYVINYLDAFVQVFKLHT